MFLYIGGVTNIPWQKVVSIHDSKNFLAPHNEVILKENFTRNKIVSLVEADKVRSVVITTEGIYLSAISASTLQKRADRFLRQF